MFLQLFLLAEHRFVRIGGLYTRLYASALSLVHLIDRGLFE